MTSFFSRLAANKHLKNGLPFFLFLGGGVFALKELRTVRYDSSINPRVNKLVKTEDALSANVLRNHEQNTRGERFLIKRTTRKSDKKFINTLKIHSQKISRKSVHKQSHLLSGNNFSFFAE